MHDLLSSSKRPAHTPERHMEPGEAAAQADFVICLYNPASKGRLIFRQACSRILKYRQRIPYAGWL